MVTVFDGAEFAVGRDGQGGEAEFAVWVAAADAEGKDAVVDARAAKGWFGG